MWTFLKTQWGWLAAVVLVLFGVLFSTQLVDYATALYHRRQLRTEQAQATAAHAQQQAAITARYTGYRLDSIKRATERHALLVQLRKLQKRDDSISKNRPARILLPAWDKLPRE